MPEPAVELTQGPLGYTPESEDRAPRVGRPSPAWPTLRRTAHLTSNWVGRLRRPAPFDTACMRASIRRIDLTQQPAEVEAWPSMDWLSGEVGRSELPRRGRPGTRGTVGGDGQGRVEPRRIAGGLVASRTTRPRSWPSSTTQFAGAEVIDLVVEAPHLAYLARVAAGSNGGRRRPGDRLRRPPPRPRRLRATRLAGSTDPGWWRRRSRLPDGHDLTMALVGSRSERRGRRRSDPSDRSILPRSA